MEIYPKHDFPLLYCLGMAEVFTVYHSYYWARALFKHGRLCPNKENSAYYAIDKKLRWEVAGSEAREQEVGYKFVAVNMYMTLARFANVCSIIIAMYYVFRLAIDLQLSCAVISSLVSLALLLAIFFHRFYFRQPFSQKYSLVFVFVTFSILLYVAVPFWEM